jgi:transcriptional regulator with GAF, ATPase, and Fis domain
MRTWLHWFSSQTEWSRPDLAAALNGLGIDVEALNPDTPGGPGVLFFTQVSAPLCDFLRAHSRDGTVQILAVADGGAALAGGDAWRLLHAGAADVLIWDDLADPVAVIAARLRRWQAVDDAMQSPAVCNNLIGQSRAWTSALRQIVEVAVFTDASVLLTGETGTGKEMVARMIHQLNPNRQGKGLVVLDCTTIVPDLSGSELFGHERGAFTGAIAARDGAFALADGGTLFLDEVGELPLSLQAQLLRGVQEHTYKRVGSNTWRTTDFRLVCATNRDLREEEARGQFRRDLYYRIAAWTFKLPPLRERAEDIIPLARHFMQQARPGEEPGEFDGTVRDYLLARHYAGNIRDLKHLVARIMHRHAGPGPITIGDIPPDERPAVDDDPGASVESAFEQAIRGAFTHGAGLKDIRRVAEEAAIRIAVDDAGGNLQRAARKLGVTDRALQIRRAEQRQRPPNGSADGDGAANAPADPPADGSASHPGLEHD